jgi:D-tyrosyl-tRNA(Tyr) deacylase
VVAEVDRKSVGRTGDVEPSVADPAGPGDHRVRTPCQRVGLTVDRRIGHVVPVDQECDPVDGDLRHAAAGCRFDDDGDPVGREVEAGPRAERLHGPIVVDPTGRSCICHAERVRGLVQRVTRASVESRADGEWATVGRIGAGLCVLVGVTHADDARTAALLADKVWNLRILDDADGVMNESLAVRHAAGSPAEVLVVSQFTLYGDTSKGRRPSWIAAARPEHAEPLVDEVVARLRASGAVVATGRFRTDMRVEIVNDGPVTVMLDV